MGEPYLDNFLPEADPAVLEYARWCIMQEILQSPDGAARLEELARDPDSYVKNRCTALFNALKEEYRRDQGACRAPGLAPDSDGDGVPDMDEDHDPFDLNDFDGDDSDAREVRPERLYMTDGDCHRLALELSKEAPMISRALRSSASSGAAAVAAGARPPRIRLSDGRGAKGREARARPVARAQGVAHEDARQPARHSRRWLESFGRKRPEDGKK